MQTKLMHYGGEIINGIETGTDRITEWSPTITQIRRAIMELNVTAVHFPDDMLDGVGPTMQVLQSDIEDIAAGALEAVRAGRLIDFGNLPNAIIKEGGNRGGPMYTQGALTQPFRDPWLMAHSWEGGVCVYLVNLLEPEKMAGGDCEVVELAPTTFNGDSHVLAIGDRVIVTPMPEDRDHLTKYAARAIPAIWRYLPGAAALANNEGPPESAAAGNVLDPLMTALMILSTRNIPRRTIHPDPKLAKARAKAGKPPIPPYDEVTTGPYVTALLARRGPRGEALGGTHASPVAHIRRGHIRTYANGQRTFVRDALINASEDARTAFRVRSHYTAKS